jgi:hypothetical protein
MLTDDALTCPATHNGGCHAAGDDDKCMLMTGDRVRREHKAAVNARTCRSARAATRSSTKIKWFNVYCFAEPRDAEKFMQWFGGERFDPKQRGKGSNWACWNK